MIPSADVAYSRRLTSDFLVDIHRRERSADRSELEQLIAGDDGKLVFMNDLSGQTGESKAA